MGQSAMPGVPTQVISVAPFVLMILVLALTSSGALERLAAPLPEPLRRRVLGALRTAPPAALGQPLDRG